MVDRHKNDSKLLIFIIFLLMLLLLTGCAVHSENTSELPGFWYGLFHGFLILFSFIGSFFTEFEIYTIPNAGTWYDFGYILGVMIFFGGGGAKARN